MERSIFVDDLITGGSTTEKAKQVKTKVTKLFACGTFELHKWHSNVKELESPIESENEVIQETYVKQQLEAPKRGEGKRLDSRGTKKPMS